MLYEPTYLGEIPLTDETLAHYGVKGMKWRRRKGRLKGKALELKAKANRRLRRMSDDQISDKGGKFTMGRHDDGRARSTSNPKGNRRYNGELEITNRGYSDKSIASNYQDRTGMTAGATRDANYSRYYKYHPIDQNEKTTYIYKSDNTKRKKK